MLNCHACHHDLTRTARITYPEDEGVVVSGGGAPHNNLYCGRCGTHVPVAVARTILFGDVSEAFAAKAALYG